MDENIRLGVIRLDYYVRGGPAETLRFARRLVDVLMKSSPDAFRVVKLVTDSDVFVGSAHVSLEIQPGEGKEKQLREVFKEFEQPAVTPSWEDVEKHLWSLWVRREDGTGYSQIATGSKEYLCTRAEEFAEGQDWFWMEDPRLKDVATTGIIRLQTDRLVGNPNTPYLYLQQGTSRKEWMGVTHP